MLPIENFVLIALKSFRLFSFTRELKQSLVIDVLSKLKEVSD